MGLDVSPPIQRDGNGRPFRQVGTSRVYYDGMPVGMDYPNGSHEKERTPGCLKSAIPSRDELPPEFRESLLHPWVEPGQKIDRKS